MEDMTEAEAARLEGADPSRPPELGQHLLPEFDITSTPKRT